MTWRNVKRIFGKLVKMLCQGAIIRAGVINRRKSRL